MCIRDRVKKRRKGTLVGVLGCMAERLKAKLMEEEKLVDMVLGPDAYRDLPKLVAEASQGEKGINVLLSRSAIQPSTPTRVPFLRFFT